MLAVVSSEWRTGLELLQYVDTGLAIKLASTALLTGSRFAELTATYNYNVALRELHRVRGADPRLMPFFDAAKTSGTMAPGASDADASDAGDGDSDGDGSESEGD